jgi:cytoskeletal protein CcmA (bactofilin family)
MARTTVMEEKKHNLITTGTVIKGEITSDSDLRIDGRIEGNLICKGKLVLGQEGVIKGEVFCQNAEIMGKIEGKMQVAELLSLKSTAKIQGDIKTSRLAIEPNAIFSGTCDMAKTVSQPAEPVLKDKSVK